MDGNRATELRKTSCKVLFNERERKGPGNLNLLGRLYPCQSLLLFWGRLMEEDILSRYSNPVQLALDDLVDQKNLFRKILLGERFFFRQIGHSAKGQKNAEEEGEKVTDPTP
jgi:hypothetical protein